MTGRSSPAPPVASGGAGLLVVVVAYHSPKLLDHCLGSLGGAFDVVVVDNSSDPAVAAVTDDHGCAYVDPGRNLGFAGGVNAGCAQRTGRDVLLLNPDAAVTPAAVRALRAALAAVPRLAAVAPAQSGPDGGAPDQVAWPFPTPGGA